LRNDFDGYRRNGERDPLRDSHKPLYIASEALRDVEFNPETWD